MKNVSLLPNHLRVRHTHCVPLQILTLTRVMEGSMQAGHSTALGQWVRSLSGTIDSREKWSKDVISPPAWRGPILGNMPVLASGSVWATSLDMLM